MRAESVRKSMGDVLSDQAVLQFPEIEEMPAPPTTIDFSEITAAQLENLLSFSQYPLDCPLSKSNCKFIGSDESWRCTNDYCRAFFSIQEMLDSKMSAAQSDVKAGEIKIKSIPLFRLAQAAAALRDIKDSRTESSHRVREMFERVLKTSPSRPFSMPPINWETQLDILCEEHPNFADVVNQNIRPSLAVIAAGGKVRPAPITLLGNPGVGKSYFAQQLACGLQCPSVKIDIAAAQSASQITGSSAFWANTEPGQVFKKLLFGNSGTEPTIDPIIFLDEIDKAHSETKFGPLASLYSLLKFESAKNFEDESFPGFQINAGYVVGLPPQTTSQMFRPPYCLVAKYLGSRELNVDEKIITFLKVFARVVESCELPSFSREIDRMIVLNHLNAGLREFKIACANAVGRALCRGRQHVEKCDFGRPGPAVLLRPRIGFLP